MVCDKAMLVPIQLLTNAQALEYRPSLQNSANLLFHNLDSLHKILASAQPLLANAHVYPLPSYPGRTQEDLLTQLLRKKLQPQVEDWIANGERHAANNAVELHHTNGSSADPTVSKPQPMSTAQLNDIWEWAGREGNRIARDMGADAFDDVFTLEEHEAGIENVVTGLRRKLWDSDDEDEDEDDQGEAQGKTKDDKHLDKDVDMVDTIPEPVKRLQRHNVDPSKPPMSIEHILRFALTAREPPNAV
jgi:mediator of RNA polymerase II transcription subunit 8